MFPDLSIWRHPAIDRLEIIHVGRHRYRVPPHIHTSMAIIWNVHGVSQVACRGINVVLNKGQSCVVSPNEIISGGFLNGDYSQYLQINTPDSLFSGRAENMLFSVKTLQSGESHEIIPALIRTLTESGTEQEAFASAQTMLDEITAAKGNWVRKKLDRSINKASRHILTSYSDAIDVKSLSEQLDLNDRYFIKLFKKAMGTTPHQFQIAVRVERARILLGASLSLSDIAVATGVSDQSHLIRCFKRQYGVPPGLFRQSIAATGEAFDSARLTALH